MCDGNDPSYIVPNGVNDFEAVFMRGTEFPVIGITFERISVGMVSNFLQSVLNFFNKFSNNFCRVRSMKKKIRPAIKLDVGVFD